MQLFDCFHKRRFMKIKSVGVNPYHLKKLVLSEVKVTMVFFMNCEI